MSKTWTDELLALEQPEPDEAAVERAMVDAWEARA